MDKSEIEAGSANVVKIDKQNRCVTVTKPNTEHGEPPRIYYFDNVFAEDSTQVSICLFHGWHFSLFTFYRFVKVMFEEQYGLMTHAYFLFVLTQYIPKAI